MVASQFKSLFSHIDLFVRKKDFTPKSYPDYCKAMRLCNYLNFALFTFNKIGTSFISTFYFFIIMT
ncbi:hypothetical protein RhiirC2_293581 [Rhizophagus irregularis]|uniref:Uncharacterized protein n=1 Tax=Rhizophagus irregularis TaxID=588596 RepID=A0A2N1MD08_9GLOM|nr:hypothetical protein RhiirC2_293581 [Rhizophagus irregularis]